MAHVLSISAFSLHQLLVTGAAIASHGVHRTLALWTGLWQEGARLGPEASPKPLLQGSHAKGRGREASRLSGAGPASFPVRQALPMRSQTSEQV